MSLALDVFPGQSSWEQRPILEEGWNKQGEQRPPKYWKYREGALKWKASWLIYGQMEMIDLSGWRVDDLWQCARQSFATWESKLPLARPAFLTSLEILKLSLTKRRRKNSEVIRWKCVIDSFPTLYINDRPEHWLFEVLVKPFYFKYWPKKAFIDRKSGLKDPGKWVRRNVVGQDRMTTTTVVDERRQLTWAKPESGKSKLLWHARIIFLLLVATFDFLDRTR